VRHTPACHDGNALAQGVAVRLEIKVWQVHDLPPASRMSDASRQFQDKFAKCSMAYPKRQHIIGKVQQP
jgi:hypothetical protein